MNEQLQTAVADILVKAATTVETAEAFILSEAPDVVQQLLAWKMWESLIYCSISLALAITAVVSVRFAILGRTDRIKKAMLAYDNKEGWTRFGGSMVTSTAFDSIMATGGMLPVVSLLLAIACAITAVTVPNLAWLQILIAPKIYLIEYASSLIK